MLADHRVPGCHKLLIHQRQLQRLIHHPLHHNKFL